jgi:hypothetical protein
MKKGRALVYGIACLLGFLGAGLAVVSFLFDGLEMSTALGMKMAMILPAICALIFLVLTESDRHKPWMKALIEREAEDSLKYQMNIVDPAKAARFGVATVGIWVLAVGLFFVIGFANGFAYAWLVFLFTFAFQMFLTMTLFVKKTE